MIEGVFSLTGWNIGLLKYPVLVLSEKLSSSQRETLQTIHIY